MGDGAAEGGAVRDVEAMEAEAERREEEVLSAGEEGVGEEGNGGIGSSDGSWTTDALRSSRPPEALSLSSFRNRAVTNTPNTSSAKATTSPLAPFPPRTLVTGATSLTIPLIAPGRMVARIRCCCSVG